MSCWYNEMALQMMTLSAASLGFVVTKNPGDRHIHSKHPQRGLDGGLKREDWLA
jgi:hypothetical protein